MALDRDETKAGGEQLPEKAPTVERNTFYRLASLVLIVVILHFGRVVLVPFVLALLLTFVLVPAVTRLERLKIGRIASVLIVISLGLAATVSVGCMVEQSAAKIASRWPEYSSSIRAKSTALIEWSDRFERYQKEIRETFTGATTSGRIPSTASGSQLQPRDAPEPAPFAVPVRIVPEDHSIWGALSTYSEELIGPFASALLVVAMLSFMLLRWEIVRERVLLLLAASRSPAINSTLEEATRRVSKVLIAQCAINGCFGLLSAIGMWIIDMSLGGRGSVTTALTAGFLCGILRFIPYVGVLIGAGLPLLLTFASYPGNLVFFVTLGMFVVLEILTSQFIEPRWLGARAGISPPGILISTVFWTWLWGPIGLLLSTPLTVLLVVMGKHIAALKSVYILLADRHATLANR
ncbi:MAG TPA: AI-2E family transporter [Phycisphaerae bacterium]|nr:AI-2E family transporter [Phycisphaerae bacterium]